MARLKPLRSSRLAFEPLEDRWLPANLQMTGIDFLDGFNVQVAAPVEGTMYRVQTRWTTDNLAASDNYILRVAVDGVPLDSPSFTGSAGTGLAFNWIMTGWYAGPGPHAVTATLDAGSAITETTEADNIQTVNFSPASATGLPAGKFEWPIAGISGKDWSVVNYNDVDPRSGQFFDYRGSTFVYDGHNAFDITLPNFARMDAGLPIFSAAGGTVVDVVDDLFDRSTGAASAGNHIEVDHGNGWSTLYYHIAKFSSLVKIGDTVAAGQPLAMVGSSGNSSDAHLHFGVYYRGLPVETMYNTATYFAVPPAYEGDAPVSVMDAGITNSNPFPNFKERPDEVATFGTSGTANPWFWYRLNHVVGGDSYAINWYRPDGTLQVTLNDNPTLTVAYYGAGWFIGNATMEAFPGTWDVALVRNGTELVRKSFTVNATGAPEVSVLQNSTYIISGRTTPIDFGSIASGSTAPQLTFTIQNVGTAVLNTSSLQLPPGFSPVGAFPSTVAAGATANFTIRLDTSVVGTKFGAVRFTTNDSDESAFWFNVTGTVTGAVSPSAPTFAETSASATLFRNGFSPVLIAPNTTLTDINSPVFTGGSVTVRFAAPVSNADTLSVRNQGTGAGQIGLSVAGTTVTYGGATIGNLSGGTGNTLNISLTSGATLASVQALLRNLTYTTTSTSTAPRYLAIQVTDNTSLASTTVYRTILPMETADVVSITPVSPNPTANPVSSIDVTFTGTLDATTFTTADLSLTRNGGPNLIDASATITSLGGGVYRIGNLSGLTDLAGTYVFGVNSTGLRTPNQVPGSTTVTTTWDNVPVRPTTIITRDPSQPAATNVSPIRFIVTFSEPVTGFAPNDVSFGAGTLTTGLTAIVSPNGVVGDSYFVDVSGVNGVGTVGINVADGAASSVPGGLSQAATTPLGQLVDFDNIVPVPSITPTSFGPTNDSTIPVTISFTEDVFGLLANEIVLLNATLSNFLEVSPKQYTFDLHPTAEGTFSATVPAGIATDGFTNLNTQVSVSGLYDITAPVATLNQSGTQVDPSNAASVQFTVVFTEPVTGLAPADIDFTGSTAPGTLAAVVTGTGTTFTVTVTGMTGDGIVKATVLPNAANDPAGNTSVTTPGTDDVIVFDNSLPTATITQEASQADPVNSGPIAFTVTFSESVVNFTSADILFTGSTVGGTLAANVVPGPGLTYTVYVTGMTGDGLVKVVIPGGAAQDAAGNNTVAATFTDNSVRFDSLAPTATITQALTQNDPTSNGPVLFSITFNESVIGFTASDLDLSSSTVGGFPVAAISGTGPTYLVSVSGMTGEGTIVVNLPAGRVTDAVGNANTAATGADRQVSFFSISVLPFLIPDGVVGTVYSKTFTAGGHPSGNVPYGYSVVAGELPPGLNLSSTGVLSGTPSQDGDFNFTVQAATQAGDIGSRAYTVSIHPAPIQLTIGGRGDGTAFQYSPDANGDYTLTSVVTPFTGGSAVPSRTAVADINKDGVPDTIFVTGPGTPIRVSAISGKDNSRIVLPLDPFGGNFTGGGFVAAADIDGDGRAEFVVTPDQGGGPRVTIFSLQANGDVRIRANFLGIDDLAFRGGARPAMGDVDGDGRPDLIVAAGFGGGPRVALYDGDTLLTTRGKLVNDFFAFPDDAATLRNGTFPALGDISGDGFADLIFGGGPGGAPRVYILSGQFLISGNPNLYSQPIANFFVDGNLNDRGGVHVAAKDADGDSKLELIVGSGENARSRVRVYLGADFSGTSEPGTYQDLDPYQGAILADGVFVG